MKWKVLRTYDNTALADMTAERLNLNDISARIDYGAYRSGVDGVRLYVRPEDVQRAELLLKESLLSEEELTRAALQKTSGSDDQ